jgi:ATP-dependent DNA ligase
MARPRGCSRAAATTGPIAIPPSARPAAKLRAKSFTLDGEAVVAGTDGVAVFDALHRRHKATDAML